MVNPNQGLIDSGWKFVLSVSGGGQEIIGDLTKYGNMSGTLLEATVPYAVPAYHKLIGGKTDQIVSPAAARAAAMACYKRALEYAPGEKVFGIASTGSVVKVGGERQGRKHRICIAVQNPSRTLEASIVYRPGRTRLEEETLTSCCIREAIKWGSFSHGDIACLLDHDDEIRVQISIGPPNVVSLVHGEVDRIDRPYEAGNVLCDPKAIFSSSCNPIHQAHINIIRDAAQRLNCQVDIELCVQNADKPPLDYLTIYERTKSTLEKLKNILTVREIILTNKPYYFDKVKLFPGAVFVVGMDTFDRILDPKYYQCAGSDVLVGLQFMEENGNQFLVYSRKGYQEVCRNYDSLEGRLIKRVTTFVTPYDGYEASDLSSTELRRKDRDVKS